MTASAVAFAPMEACVKMANPARPVGGEQKCQGGALFRRVQQGGIDCVRLGGRKSVGCLRSGAVLTQRRTCSCWNWAEQKRNQRSAENYPLSKTATPVSPNKLI